MAHPVCTKYYLPAPIVIAVATDKYLTPKTAFSDIANLPGVSAPMYGQDMTFGIGRTAPNKQSVGNNESDLRQKMWNLLDVFAAGDKSGMTKRLFTEFLNKRKTIIYFDDWDLNLAAARHPNIKHFCKAALSGYIHPALRNAKWNINNIAAPTNLGVPAFNNGVPYLRTGDFNNGLSVMINSIQHVYVVAKNYDYEEGARSYSLTLRYFFYDVFGLDDDDLKEFGATSSDDWMKHDAMTGITAWWQLQHQFGYAPLVTRTVVDQSFKVPAQ